VTSSDEDFEFLEKELRGKDKLDDLTYKMLVGVIQPRPKDRKRYDRVSREELRAKMKAALGDAYSDEYGDEDADPNEEFDEFYNSLKSAKSRNTV